MNQSESACAKSFNAVISSVTLIPISLRHLEFHDWTIHFNASLLNIKLFQKKKNNLKNIWMNYHEILLPELVFGYVCLCSWGVCSQNSVIHWVCVKNAIRLMSLNEEHLSPAKKNSLSLKSVVKTHTLTINTQCVTILWYATLHNIPQ